MKSLFAVFTAFTCASICWAEYYNPMGGGYGGYGYGAGSMGGYGGYGGGYGGAYPGFGAIGPNGMPLNGPYGGAGYMRNPNMQLLSMLLARAKQSTYKSNSSSSGSSGGGGGSQGGASQASEAIGKNLKAVTEGIAKGQEAVAESSKPIQEISLSSAFTKLVEREDEPWRDPLGGLSENMQAMNEQLMKSLSTMQLSETEPAATQPPATIMRPLTQQKAALKPTKRSSNKMNTAGPALGNPRGTARGLASVYVSPDEKLDVPEAIMHRNLHAQGGQHGAAHQQSRSLRVIPYE